MRNSIWNTAVVACVPLLAPAVLAQTPAPSQIVVTGTGEARVVPDRATIVFGVQSRATTAAAAGSDNARRLRAVLDTLKSMGLSGDQLSTVNYSVSPEMQYSPTGNQPPKVTGYVVNNSVRADLHRIDDVGRAIDAALAKGANEVTSLQLTTSKGDSIRRVALAAAVADARAQAEVLARAAGGTLGGLIELSSAQEPIRPILQPMMRVSAAMAPTRTPIEAGEQTTTATVTARWTFVGGR
jgi:uncharacterized protein YggE